MDGVALRDIVSEVRAVVHSPRRRAFEVLVPIDLTTIFRGMGPLPAVSGVEDQVGDWDAVGQTRTVRLADGSSLREELTAFDPPAHFAYTIDRLTGALRHLVHGMKGAWWFEEGSGDDGSPTTAIRWRYAFQPRNAFARPLAVGIIRLFWQRYMVRALALGIEQVEHRTDASP